MLLVYLFDTYWGLGPTQLRAVEVNVLNDHHIIDNYHTFHEPCTLRSWKLEAEKPFGTVAFSIWKLAKPNSLIYTYLGKTTPSVITHEHTVMYSQFFFNLFPFYLACF